MRLRYSILSVMLIGLWSITALAQQTNISGTIKDASGNALPGVNVIVKGTANGTVSDAEGKFTLSAPDASSILVFTFIGFATQEVEVAGRSVIDVSLAEDTKTLSEVVVTALGLERTTKALQSSVTQIDGSNFTQARENGFAAQLEGRVAGVNVTKAASGPAGSTRVVIRGAKTLLGANQPLYVIDGIPMDNTNFGQSGQWGGADQGDGLNSINPDDIQSMTVLKGASSAALYGARAANGVILVTTKKGTARKGIGVEFNSNFVTESLINYRDFQTSNGAGGLLGTTLANSVATKGSTVADWPTAFNNGWNSNGWGPKFDGTGVIQPDGVVRPYLYSGDNFKRFFQSGNTATNSIALSGGNEKQSFRFSVADLQNKGVVPNSGFKRDNITVSSSSKFGNKITLVSKLMYSHEEATNRPILSDSPGNAIQAIYTMPGDQNVTLYRQGPKLGAVPVGMITPDNKPVGAELQATNNLWGQNPYWAAYQFINSDVRDRVNASANLRYDITKFLYATAQGGMDWYTKRGEALTPQGTGYQATGSMSETENRVRETNWQWTLGFDKSFSKFHVNAFIGGNRMRNTNESISISGNGFSVPYFVAINNVASRNWNYGYTGFGINSVFGSAEVAYDNYLFLTATVRKDWFSVLNPSSNNITYPSVGASFIFTDAIKDLPRVISFGKLRASYGVVGNGGVTPYTGVNNTYSLGGGQATHLGIPLGYFSSANQNASGSANFGTLPNPSLQPWSSAELEFGTDLRFFQNRLGLDVAYYSQETTKDILPAQISQASGWGSTFVNIGKLQNRGIEVLLTGTVVKTSKITWDASINFARNQNKVVYLIAGTTVLPIESPRTFTAQIESLVGSPFGVIAGVQQTRTPSGQLVYDANGAPITDNTFKPIGNGVPNFTGGFNNTVTYKSFSLGMLIDFKSGGKMYSGTNVRMTEWGYTKQTLQGRSGEAPLTVTGATQTGTDASGNPVYAPFTKTLTPGEAKNYWSQLGERAQDRFTYDASFIKLRQLTLGYNFPKSMLVKTPIQVLTLSFVARNLLTLYKNTPNIDPEAGYSSSNGQGLDYFGLPPTRSYGFNLKVTF